VTEAGWKTVRLQDVPDAAQSPGFSRDEYLDAMAERAPHILDRWADARARFEHTNRKTHDVRGFLGVESFGANAFEAHAGELLVVPHDELGEGEQQEELYLVVEGRARFVCDGKRSSSAQERCSMRGLASGARRPPSRRLRCSSSSVGALRSRTRLRSGRATGAKRPAN
jgi:hypothetical protein